jgi:S-(hydroxymethyl)glutathione dehydrogenase/alcohol dehydrogenase
MKTEAAVLVELGQPLVMAELEVPALRPGQVLVEVVASGVCHTQILEARGYRGEDRFLPHCLGHEGMARVLEVGEGVHKVAPGDQVILSWIKGSGHNVPGSVYGWGERQVNAGAVTTFMRHAVVSENRVTAVPEGLDRADAALLGCAAATGLGAVLNTAAARAGDSLVVFGTGGIGSCAVAAAAAAGCAPIIGVDVMASKLKLARQMGATHTVDGAATDPVARVFEICPGGADHAIEASGRPEAMAQALRSVRPQGGAAVVIGNARFGEMLTIDPQQLNQGKQLKGTWGGDSAPDSDFRRYAALLAAGRLDFKPLRSEPYPLSAVNRALDDLEHGLTPRPVIDMSLG